MSNEISMSIAFRYVGIKDNFFILFKIGIQSPYILPYFLDCIGLRTQTTKKNPILLSSRHRTALETVKIIDKLFKRPATERDDKICHLKKCL